jgi:transglutaminase-like putative cysteine protease
MGVEDHWSSPLETLQTHRGDCEDYAIVKYVALRQAGLPTADVKIVILRNQFPNEYHAVAAARVMADSGQSPAHIGARYRRDQGDPETGGLLSLQARGERLERCIRSALQSGRPCEDS